MFEARDAGFDNCCFVTLTYDNEFNDGNLHKDHLQAYVKRLRYFADSVLGKRFRFFACGEYGRRTSRPHYHLILLGLSEQDYRTILINAAFVSDKFGHRFKQTQVFAITDLVWQMGLTRCDPCNEQTIAYVAGYCNKVLAKYPDVLAKPFRLMSRRPGIGHDYIMSNPQEVLYRRDLNDGFVTLSRYIEDKLYPEGTDKRIARNIAKERWLLTQQRLYRDWADESGKTVEQLKRELNKQIKIDLESLTDLHRSKL